MVTKGKDSSREALLCQLERNMKILRIPEYPNMGDWNNSKKRKPQEEGTQYNCKQFSNSTYRKPKVNINLKQIEMEILIFLSGTIIRARAA